MIEKIDRLLRSRNTEDIIVGVKLAHDNLGRSWAKDNFIGYRPSNENQPYFTDFTNFNQTRIIKFPTYFVYVGMGFIQYYSYSRTRSHPIGGTTEIDFCKKPKDYGRKSNKIAILWKFAGHSNRIKIGR